jgi:hypothetical protein
MNIPVFDLHCDTVTELLGRDFSGRGNLRSNSFHIDLERGHTLPGYAQCFAFWSTTDLPLPKGMKPEDICVNVLNEFEMEILDEFDISFKCDCTRNKVEKALISTGVKELEDMAKDEVTSVGCQFCRERYDFTSADITRILIKASK